MFVKLGNDLPVIASPFFCVIPGRAPSAMSARRGNLLTPPRLLRRLCLLAMTRGIAEPVPKRKQGISLPAEEKKCHQSYERVGFIDFSKYMNYDSYKRGFI
ncbi:MAG: hypothetical protein A2Z75_07465 [Chloroflexi bacterium RBG_13_50_10]|jgi:hypothetical protein|nr:MAG: hypothetical protein A2Z75_07465 [Chloroflexi bacterium RBG_13_50_10]